MSDATPPSPPKTHRCVARRSSGTNAGNGNSLIEQRAAQLPDR
ncbi:MAG: hypothetical protein AW07_04483 [Candidatus Accumulibacter sp. SK-11]|nr:MAG: hypothetical protein AW07_04483 [Candidatus Accumulibacter sp. SK-11]